MTDTEQDGFLRDEDGVLIITEDGTTASWQDGFLRDEAGKLIARIDSGAASAIGTFVTTIGDGSSTTLVVVHNLASSDVMVTAIDLSTKEIVYPTVTVTDANNLSIQFSVAPAANGIRILVVSV